MIHSIRIQNFKSLRDVTLRLQDVNLLIGPNNSGKSNVLKALAFLGDCIEGNYPDREELRRISHLHHITSSNETAIRFTICLKLNDGLYYYDLRLFDIFDNKIKHNSFLGKSMSFIDLSEFDDRVNVDKFEFVRFYTHASTSYFYSDEEEISYRDKQAFHHIEKYKGNTAGYVDDDKNTPNNFINYYSPDHLEKEIRQELYKLRDVSLYNIKLSSFTGITTQQVVELKSDASNLMSYLDYLNNNHPFKLMEIAKELNKCVSDFKLVRTPQIDLEKKDNVRQVKLFDKNDIGFWADEVSEGTLYFLALLCIIFQPNPPSILMLEEPEKGIHPRRLHEVMEYIFELAEEQGVQIILTSHSSHVVDKFKDWEESIFIVDKPDNETIIKNLQTDVIDDSHRRSEEKNTPKVNYRRALGDHWVTGLLGGVPA